MDINRALALAAAAGDVELGRMYATAVARGGSNADCTAEEDHVCGMARLVTLALIRASDLALSAHLLDMIDENDQDPLVARAASDASAGTLRLAHRAVEMHSRDVGYETGVWIERALLHAAAELEWRANGRGRGRAGGAGRARSATTAIARASEAAVSDCMVVPEQLAEALGHLLALRTREGAGRMIDCRYKRVKRWAAGTLQAPPAAMDLRRGRVPPGVRRSRAGSRERREPTAVGWRWRATRFAVAVPLVDDCSQQLSSPAKA